MYTPTRIKSHIGISRHAYAHKPMPCIHTDVYTHLFCMLKETGSTPLMMAASKGHDVIVQYLLQRGAGTKTVNKVSDQSIDWFGDFLSRCLCSVVSNCMTGHVLLGREDGGQDGHGAEQLTPQRQPFDCGNRTPMLTTSPPP